MLGLNFACYSYTVKTTPLYTFPCFPSVLRHLVLHFKRFILLKSSYCQDIKKRLISGPFWPFIPKRFNGQSPISIPALWYGTLWYCCIKIPKSSYSSWYLETKLSSNDDNKYDDGGMVRLNDCIFLLICTNSVRISTEPVY